jgi:hypothetical protein
MFPNLVEAISQRWIVMFIMADEMKFTNPARLPVWHWVRVEAGSGPPICGTDMMADEFAIFGLLAGVTVATVVMLLIL